jgi:threonine/homoserine/homoserine lactone efflux protein
LLVAAVFGFVFGFVGSMPIAGPISALVFRCGVVGQLKRGLGITLGAAVAEGIYAFLAFWGVGSVFASEPWLLPISKLVGGVILIGLGVTFLRRPDPKPSPDGEAPRAVDRTGKSSIPLGFGITIINPTLIATWSAVAATSMSTGLVSYSKSGALGFAIGVSLGITVWFAALLRLIDRFREQMSATLMRRVVQGIGGMLLGVGAWFLYSAATS